MSLLTVAKIIGRLKPVHWIAAALVAATISLPPALSVAQQVGPRASTAGWTMISRAHVDLWFHGLAVIGFDQDGELPLYSPDYVAKVRAAKEEMGIYPTVLDSLAERLLEDFGEDQAFQNFHFVPLYFPNADRESMFRGLRAVADRRFRDTTVVGPDNRAGVRWGAIEFEDRGVRGTLRRFLDALDNEWDVFFSDYWQREIALEPGDVSDIERRWDEDLAPAIAGFLGDQGLKAGIALVSPVLGPEGRLVQGDAFRGISDAVAVWYPDRDAPDASAFAVVRELCFSIIDGSVINPRTVRGEDPETMSGRAAVHCGSLLLDRADAGLAERYQHLFLRALGADTAEAAVTAAFEDQYAVPDPVLTAIRAKVWPDEVAASLRATQPGWSIKSGAQVDLWFHSLAVIAADEPGPLGLYSADYARRIRELKQERGVYPTMLDSLGTRLREQIADENNLDVIHFIPLYFPQAEPDRMLQALEAVAERRTESPDLAGPDVRSGVLLFSQVYERGGSRRLLRSLVQAMQTEWDVFYRSFWEQMHEEQTTRYDAIQAVWDSLFVPPLGPYLERRKLTAGTVFPSPAIGPEGRIVDESEIDPRDQVVSVQMPLSSQGPEASVFAFLKELCFLLVDPSNLGVPADGGEDFEDLRRRVAVRCGHLVLQFYAPTLTSAYRRVFLDAVGAEESSTVDAFNRVYALSPEVFERLREQIRRR